MEQNRKVGNGFPYTWKETWYIARRALEVGDEKILLGQSVICVEKNKMTSLSYAVHKSVPGGLKI